ncbi:hypothetical protein [Massilia sp. UBA6681]|uniref:hypothetical protein n=1 Tax=Massilia sp. UBA6681 TaxID=1946839 RepID=UPI0025C15EB7|nr:hypothetical protein [Massilia sp. UBA6681]
MNMSRKLLSRIYLSAFLSAGASIGGWAITSRFAGDVAAASFLYLSIPIVIGVLVLQAVLFMNIKDRVCHLVLFNIVSAFGVLWMMFCLVLPLLWMDSIYMSVRIVIFCAALLLFYLNIIKGLRNFRLRWGNIGRALLGKHYKSDRGLIAWEEVIGSLKLSISFHVPGIPQKLEPILSVVLVISMLAGLSLRKIFPTFSIFAWSIPSLICIATILQIVGAALGQYFVLRELEKKDKTTIHFA